jgi:hypothetical protein
MSFPRRPGKPCGYCGQWFRSRRRPETAQFCSRPCAAKARPRAWRVAMGRKGGLAKAKTPIDWAAIARLGPVEAFKLGRSVRKAWFGNRVQAAYRKGYSAGYEAACEACAALGWQTRRSA